MGPQSARDRMSTMRIRMRIRHPITVPIGRETVSRHLIRTLSTSRDHLRHNANTGHRKSSYLTKTEGRWVG